MANHVSLFKVQGMAQDRSASAFESNFAYENKNLRITATKDGEMLNISNEKGTKKIQVPVELETEGIKGYVIGTCEINNKTVIFSTDNDSENKIDRIYLFDNLNDSEHNLKILAEGDFNFNILYPIESLSMYESESIQKVYFTDGLNQLRFINICDGLIDDENTLNISPKVSGKYVVQIEKLDSGGNFSAGTIQYVITLSKENGQQSNYIYVSPLLYCSNTDKANDSESSTYCSFKIFISAQNIEEDLKTFNKINIYSVQRTSTDGTTVARKVTSFDLKGVSRFIDTGTVGENISATDLYYLGSGQYTFETLTSKDNKLFLGGIGLKEYVIKDESKVFIKNNCVITDIANKNIYTGTIDSLYGYELQLSKNSSKITTFKQREFYRFGVQFKNQYGTWSEPVFLGDRQISSNIENDNCFNDDYTKLIVPTIELEIPDDILNNYVSARPVVVYPQENERYVVCQGILYPTVFNVRERGNGTTHVQSSWFARPNPPYDVEFYGVGNDTTGNHSLKPEIREQQLLSRGFKIDGDSEDNYKHGAVVFSNHYHPLFSANKHGNDEIGTWYTDLGNEIYVNQHYPQDSEKTIYMDPDIKGCNNSRSVDKYINENSDLFFVDRSIVTLHSPEIDFNESFITKNYENLSLKIIGVAPVTSHKGENSLLELYKAADNSSDRWIMYPRNTIYDKNSSHAYKLLCSYIMIGEEWSTLTSLGNKNNYLSTPWMNQLGQDSGPTQVLHANIRYSHKTKYFNKDYKIDITDAKFYNVDNPKTLLLKEQFDGEGNLLYKAEIDNIITPSQTESKVLQSSWMIQHDSKGTQKIGIEYNFVRMTYSSGNHVVMPLSFDVDNNGNVFMNELPTHKYNGIWQNRKQSSFMINPFWDSERNYYFKPQEVDIISEQNFDLQNHGYYWIAELVDESKKDNRDRFGGTTEEALKNNKWNIAGEEVELNKNITLKCTEGDTYYQRYDNLNTFSKSENNQNQIVDIVSFMCETHINIDGRYDNNRGVDNILYSNYGNFNKINTAYTQQNNFYTERIFNEKENKFPSQITWTLSKTLGEEIDNWTNITMAATMNLEGRYGKINRLINFNDKILSFQDNAISWVKYNEDYAITTNQNVPIQIANSSSVDGYDVLSNEIGCLNKWSISKTNDSVYFIDDHQKRLYQYDSQKFIPLSDTKGMSSFFKKNCNDFQWNPIPRNNFISFVDKINKDVLFVNNNYCLAYNELLECFTSFYSYNKAVYMIKNHDKNYWLYLNNKQNTDIYEMHAGDFNNFFDEIEDYYTTIIANEKPYIDKTFNNIEFRGDSLEDDSETFIKGLPFNKIKVWNEYQTGEEYLTPKKCIPSNLKKKYRMWRINIPRQTGTLNRMRNPWLWIQLYSDNKKDENIKRTTIHDIDVYYFE